ncbi:cytochrome C oxidase subunit I [Pedobacter sp. BS3]|nr:cytochrome C oxidase subunit I [Pedobacter sp. BS3]
MVPSGSGNLIRNTTYKVVLPFYLYAGIAYLAATVVLLFSTPVFTGHYFHPQIAAITHIMALGWGTMIILGAGHQLVPVLIEGKLFSNTLAYLSFVTAGAGIPLLVYSFYIFNMGWLAQTGAILINAAVLSFLVNIWVSTARSKADSVHAVFVFTATLWLFITTLIGVFLVYNFTRNILPENSLYYLSLHAHIGIVGWFLLLVIGVASRLIPMFLISKYSHPKTLWIIYYLINAGLLAFIIIFFYGFSPALYLMPVAAIAAALVLFARYCYRAYKQRIRKQTDEQVKISLLAVLMMLLPILFLVVVITLLLVATNTRLVLAYGFSVFFGWLTAIVLGMTFKTLPFIVWNKVYHDKAGLGKTPNPKDLFSSRLFTVMGITYLAGFGLFIAGILLANALLLRTAALLLLLTAIFYNKNVIKVLTHKPQPL